MEIRIRATAAETEQATAALRTAFDVQSVSRFYPDRGDTVLGRTFVQAVPLPTVGRLLTAASPEPPRDSIVAGLGGEHFYRGATGNWWLVGKYDNGYPDPIGEPVPWPTIAGEYGPVSIVKLGNRFEVTTP